MAPPRIVSLSPGATDAICALGLLSSLVGRSHDCIGPPPLLALPCVTFSNPSQPKTSPDVSVHHHKSLALVDANWELLHELKPNLIFIQNQNGKDARLPHRTVREWVLGADTMCRVVSLQSHTVEDIFRNLETIADLCGVQEEGAKLVSGLRSRWKLIKQKTPQWADGMPRISVACLSSVNPMIGAGYWIPEIISCAGGLSLCGRAGCPVNSLTLGELLQRDPDLIIFLCHGLNIENLTGEVSWLDSSKDWKQLRAIKANRFFLVDADRFFIDSGPNLVLSAEVMAEIFHGFGFGHEGKSFLRWQGYVSAKEMEVNEGTVQENPTDMCSGERCERELSLDTVTKESLHLKQPSRENFQVGRQSLILEKDPHDHPKYVTNAYQNKRPCSVERDWQISYDGKSKPDVWNGDSGFEEVKQEDVTENVLFCKNPDVKAKVPRCLDTKNNRNMTPMVTEVVNPVPEDTFLEHPGGKWEKPTEELYLYDPAGLRLPQSSIESFNSFHVVNHKGRTEKENPVQVMQSPEEQLVNTHNILRNSSLDLRETSAVHATKNDYHDQELFTKIWSSIQSAGKARAMHKSRSVPVSGGSSVGKNLDNGVPSTKGSEGFNKWKSLRRLTASSSLTSHDHKLSAAKSSPGEPNRVISRSVSSILGEDIKMLKRPQLQRVDSSVGRCSSGRSIKKKSFNSTSFSSTSEILPRKATTLRDSILSSLADIQSVDCLLLSGGLASSILAEGAPLVHSQGFKLGISVLAGPAATDRAYAEAVVKRCGMKHVVIGGKEKGSSVALLARELSFVVGTLKTFDPIQIRNTVPIAAALREAKNQGFDYVVTGDGMDELFSGDTSIRVSINDEEIFQQETSKAICSSAVLLGKALGVKVLQPFLRPKLVEDFKTLIHVDKVAIENGTLSILRAAFPEVAATGREKHSIEVGSGMSFVREYFSTAISVLVLQNKANRIYQKERVRIRDAEHLVYYRAFKRAFKGKVPTNKLRWGSEPCSGCGYQLSSGVNGYCVVCGQDSNQVVQGRIKHSCDVTPENLSPSQSSNNTQLKDRSRSSIFKDEADQNAVQRDSIKNFEISREINPGGLPKNCKASNEGTKPKVRHNSKRFGNERNQIEGTQSTSGICKRTSKTSAGAKGLVNPTSNPETARKPIHFLVLGAGSAALFLLFQLSRK